MKRFYERAASVALPHGHTIALDGKPIKTPAGRDLLPPTAALAAAIATEWDAQPDQVIPAAMPLMSIACQAIDRTAQQRQTVIQQVAGYAGTDLVCYRAARPASLVQRQQEVWQPLIDWTILRYDAPLETTAGVIPKPQPEASLRTLAAAVAEYDNFTLTALQLATAACGSLIIALALLEGRLDAEAAFAASQLDESFQIEAWGEDAEQTERRQALAADITAAARFVVLLAD